jgi:hypothetical protein
MEDYRNNPRCIINQEPWKSIIANPPVKDEAPMNTGPAPVSMTCKCGEAMVVKPVGKACYFNWACSCPKCGQEYLLTRVMCDY